MIPAYFTVGLAEISPIPTHRMGTHTFGGSRIKMPWKVKKVHRIYTWTSKLSPHIFQWSLHKNEPSPHGPCMKGLGIWRSSIMHILQVSQERSVGGVSFATQPALERLGIHSCIRRVCCALLNILLQALDPCKFLLLAELTLILLSPVSLAMGSVSCVFALLFEFFITLPTFKLLCRIIMSGHVVPHTPCI